MEQKWKIVVAVDEGKRFEYKELSTGCTVKYHHRQSVAYPGSCLLGSLAA